MIDKKINKELKETKVEMPYKDGENKQKRIVTDSDVKGFKEAFEFIKRMDRFEERSSKVSILVGGVDSKEEQC